jgi:hypothetical protein
MMSDRITLKEAFLQETGLRPSEAVLCQRVDEAGAVHTWFEPLNRANPATNPLAQSIEAARTMDKVRQQITTQRALVEFARASGAPQDLLDEASLYLDLL